MKEARERGGTELEGESISRQPELVERHDELQAVDELIEPSGRGRVLAIEGPPGIGKTSLILEARVRGQRAGMRVLGARGSELESVFSFGVVRQLFEPLLARVDEEERVELLAGAAGLATPLFEPSQLEAEPAADVALTMLHGLYWLTANVASSRPLLLAIDDLHWCDRPSLRWLTYLLPRLDGLDVAVIVGVRSAERAEDPALVDQFLSDPLATVVHPAPLTEAAAAQLVRSVLAPDADDAFCAACHEITGGNPLFLHELLNVLAAEEIVPVGTVAGLRELAARAGWRTVSLRLARLTPEARRLAHAVAILGEDADPYDAAALAGLDEGETSTATADLVRVDVLRPGAPLGFVHPVIREAVYAAIAPLERTGAHARAASLLAESGAEPERVAAHLLLVPPPVVTDEASGDVVDILRAAARSAGRNGATESAVAYLRRALAEAPTAMRADLLLELGALEALVSGDIAVEHLREAHELVVDPVRRAETAVLLGRQLFYLHRVEESVDVFTRGMVEVGEADDELHRLFEVGLVTNGLFEHSGYRDATERLKEVRTRSGGSTAGEKMLLSLLAYHDARAGVSSAVAVPLALRALADGTLLAAENGGSAFVCACMVLAMADHDGVVEIYDAALEEANRHGSSFAFAAAKAFRAQAFVMRGDLADAEADAREALAACEAWDVVRARVGDCTAFLSDALMEQGELDEAAAALARDDLAGSMSRSAHVQFLLDSHARLLLRVGDQAAGLEELLRGARRFEAVGGRNPAWMAWRSQAALVLLQLDRSDEARRLVAEEVALARTWGAPRALGAALRAAGIVEGGAEGLARLEEAVAVLSDSPAKLEHAKARTELGAALRRANRRSEAREHLRRAVELATICGAVPLAAHAETELLATGARPRRIALRGVEALTPSERRVADMAANGPTNREIAQALFITPKTVEVHLSSVYRKLGIHSRSQLATALAAARPGGPVPSEGAADV